MLQQQLISGNFPYVLKTVPLIDHPPHFHVELELTYCLEGQYRLVQNGQKFEVSKGDIVLVGSNIVHEYLVSEPTKILLLEVGPMFLKSHFKHISGIALKNPVVKKDNSDFYANLHACIKNLLAEENIMTPASDMAVYGEIYKLCATVAKNALLANSVQMKKSTQHMEKALELIYYHYHEDLRIENVAAETGYGKSVFCKNFKKFTGMGFHAFLNNYRINTACYLLTETDLTIDNIAIMVGFKDSKSFSRVFKEITNTPPGQYRRLIKHG